MGFEILLIQAKKGNETAVMEIVEMYKPLLVKNAIVGGVLDEDLYQELVKVLLSCIKQYRVIK
ncbi:helix-turn-helix domain-containing protein [Blautia coccoides]|uniref:Helix-turn-helix conjugative transposon-like domain-containing protein n=1 Tax=Blautia hominis TaxID=2025493 RepID=A0ABQ0BKP9_9FIRM|nr:helix-turn-helix domain-containing protein [Blautia coccoides]MCQ4640903.1 helix-turn-helix domain-containing protein [Blautia coccoides]